MLYVIIPVFLLCMLIQLTDNMDKIVAIAELNATEGIYRVVTEDSEFVVPVDGDILGAACCIGKMVGATSFKTEPRTFKRIEYYNGIEG